jgi:hypothetical protein
MTERKIPDRDPGLEPHTPPDGEPAITSPDSQDVERDARPETRVNNAGVEVAPRAKDKADMDPVEPDKKRRPPDR